MGGGLRRRCRGAERAGTRAGAGLGLCPALQEAWMLSPFRPLQCLLLQWDNNRHLAVCYNPPTLFCTIQSVAQTFQLPVRWLGIDKANGLRITYFHSQLTPEPDVIIRHQCTFHKAFVFPIPSYQITALIQQESSRISKRAIPKHTQSACEHE